MTSEDLLPRPRLVAPGGPVTRALNVMRVAEPLPNNVILFTGDPAPASLAELRERFRRQVEADLDRAERMIAALDLLDRYAGHEDDEDGGDDEPSLGSINPTLGSGLYESSAGLVRFDGTSQLCWSRGGTDDRELGDDNGIADEGGVAEQYGSSHLSIGGVL